jgi:hypothetical protein
MNSRTLTLQTLIDKDACEDQVDLFRAKFGESVEVTEALCRSVAFEFSWSWAADKLLSKRSRANYQAKVRQIYDDYAAKLHPPYDDCRERFAALFARCYMEDQP